LNSKYGQKDGARPYQVQIKYKWNEDPLKNLPVTCKFKLFREKAG
jgi:hypothetical protein